MSKDSADENDPTANEVRAGRFAEIMRAAAEGDAATVGTLIHADPSLVNAVGPHPFWGGEPTPLQVAAEWGRIEVAKLLLDAGADPNAAASRYGGWTPLHCALNRDHGPAAHNEVAQMLIARGATIDIWAAARLGDVARLQSYMDGDSTAIQSRGPNDATPLHFAGSVEVARLLLDRGADPAAHNCYGHTPLEGVAGAGSARQAVASYLIERTGDVDIFLACAVGDARRVRSFLESDPHAVHSTIAKGRFMIGGGLADGETPLHVAASGGHTEVAQLLIEHGADVNARATLGHRPLHFAARNGHIPVAGLLLDGGADLNVRENQHNATPLDWARFHGHAAMMKFLKSHGGQETA